MGEVARFWNQSLEYVEQMPRSRYERYLLHYLDFLDYQEEAMTRARNGDDDDSGEEVV